MNSDPRFYDVFLTDLGWMAIAGRAELLSALTFGHPSSNSARESILRMESSASPREWRPELVERLTRYASGEVDDFLDVLLEERRLTPFQSAVLQRCRHIAYGHTLTYGQLAIEAGYPGAARAVGSVMAGNRVPLVIPCHRVLRSGGVCGAYSGVGGPDMKARLLRMEQSRLAPADDTFHSRPAAPRKLSLL